MKAAQKKCGTCKHLKPRDNGKPFYHGGSYKCLWQPPAIVWPASVQEGSHNDVRGRMESPGTYMEPGDGKDCPCWELKQEGSR